MGWIKRNLFFVIGGVIALGLLGAAGFYIYKGWSRNNDAIASLSQAVETLKGLTGKTPSPGNNKIDNYKAANEENQALQAWMAKAQTYFKPIASIPDSTNVDGATYSSALQKTIEKLQHETDEAGVMVPQKFGFSFTAEKDRVTFDPNGLNRLAEQLGEVKALSEILFAARINAIDSIQRVRVSDDDTGGPQADYTDQLPVTNTLAVVTPFVISIRCFTPELSRVLASLATSSSPFIVRSVNVQRAASALSASVAGAPGNPYPPMTAGMPSTAMAQAAGKGGLPTVLKEQLLSITIEVDLVKLLPKT